MSRLFQNPFLLAAPILLFTSITFVGIGAYFGYQNYQLVSHGVQVPGTVIELSHSYNSRQRTTYAPVFQFATPDHELHSVQSNTYSNPPSFHVGEQVKVVYKVNDPDSAEINSIGQLWLLPGVFLIVGSIALVISVVMLINGIRGIKTRSWLKQHGQRVITEIQSVEQDTTVRLNGRSPFRITSRWTSPMSQEPMFLKSDFLWQDPKPFLQERKTIDALVDPTNPKRYWIDTDSLQMPS